MGKEATVNTRPFALAVSLALASVLSLGVVGCDQPLPKCDVTQSMVTGGNFAAKYTLKAGSAKGMGDCAKLTTEILYFGSFYKRTSGNRPDYSQVSIGIQPGSTLGPLDNAQGAMVMPNPADKPYAYGKFDRSEPNSDGFCEVSVLSPSRVRLPVAPAWEGLDPNDPDGIAMITNPEQPATDLKFEFSNVQVYMTVGSPGRQVSAKLIYSRALENCTAEYTVSALFPATPCGLDGDGAPVGSKADNDKECRDSPVFADDAVACDTDAHLCVLSGAVPSFR